MDVSQLNGWLRRPEAVGAFLAELPRPSFTEAAPHLLGDGVGKTTLLYNAWKDVNGGSYLDYPAQTIGDCVSQGFGHGVDLLEAVEIAIGKKPELFKSTATEAVYALARVDIGGGQMGNDDGAVGAWAAKAVSTLGTLPREVVGPYDGNRAKLWGAKGLTDDLKAKAAEHKVAGVALVQTYQELEDALANGYPVPVCSDQGFTMTRDADGFCSPRGTWNHCMLIVGVRVGDRPGACILQSWGKNVPDGPLTLDQPDNSFWADRSVVERMLSLQDSWALSRFDGYPSQILPEHWTYQDFA